ncbi:hypothetical protein PV326_012487, partial [Microctonus aethiopoides]
MEPEQTKLQNLWQLKQDWDDCLLQELHTKWNQYQQGLVHLKDIEIPRCTLREHAQHSNHIPIMCEIYSYAIKKLTLARFALCAALLLALLPKKMENVCRKPCGRNTKTNNNSAHVISVKDS